MSSTATATETRASSSAASSSSLSVRASSTGASLRPTSTRFVRNPATSQSDTNNTFSLPFRRSSSSAELDRRPLLPRQSFEVQPTPASTQTARKSTAPRTNSSAALKDFLDPVAAWNLQQLGKRGEPVWSCELEDKFLSRSPAAWIDFKDKVEQAKLDCLAHAVKTQQVAGSAAEEEWVEREKDAKERFQRLLYNEGFTLLGLRVEYWLFELNHGVAPSHIVPRLSLFAPSYRPTSPERAAVDPQRDLLSSTTPFPLVGALQGWWCNVGAPTTLEDLHPFWYS